MSKYAADLLSFWRGSDPQAYPRNGVHTTLASDIAAATGGWDYDNDTLDVTVSDATNLPESDGIFTVVGRSDPKDVRECFYGWASKDGSVLKGCKRETGLACSALDDVYISIPGHWLADLIEVLETHETDTAAKIPTAQKGAASGVAELDADGKVPSDQVPLLVITDIHVAANEAAQLLLTVQKGDVCVRSDENKSYIALNSDNVDMGDWQELLTPTNIVLSVCGKTGAVTLVVADITGLQAALDGKAAADHTHGELRDYYIDSAADLDKYSGDPEYAGDSFFVKAGAYTLVNDLVLRSGQTWHFESKNGGVVLDGDGSFTVKTPTASYEKVNTSTFVGAVVTMTGADLEDPAAHPELYKGIWNGQIFGVSAADDVADTVTFDTVLTDPTTPDVVWVVKDYTEGLKLSGRLTITNASGLVSLNDILQPDFSGLRLESETGIEAMRCVDGAFGPLIVRNVTSCIPVAVSLDYCQGIRSCYPVVTNCRINDAANDMRGLRLYWCREVNCVVQITNNINLDAVKVFKGIFGAGATGCFVAGWSQHNDINNDGLDPAANKIGELYAP